MILGLLMFVLGSLVAAMGSDIYSLILGRFLQGCGAVAGVSLALLADLTRVDQRNKAMALIGIAIGASFGLALVLGPLVASQAGLKGVFFVSAALGALAILIFLVLVPEPGIRQASAIKLADIYSLARHWRIYVSAYLLHFQLVVAFAIFPLLMREAQIADSDHALHYLLLLAVSFVMVMPLMWLADRLKDIRLLACGMVVLMGTALLMTWQEGYWILMAAMLLFFAGFNLLETLLPANLGKLAGAGQRGVAMGTYSSCQFLGIFTAGLVSGLTLQLSDMTWLIVGNLLICLAWTLILMGLRPTKGISSRTLPLAGMEKLSAKERVKALLSIDGVLDAVVIESDEVAYLKVDEAIFDDKSLTKLKEEKSWLEV